MSATPLQRIRPDDMPSELKQVWETLNELTGELGVAAGCGSCAQVAEEILHEETVSGGLPRLYVPAPA